MAEKLLTISILMSGREDTTERCLKSLEPLLTKMDSELILVDTGCKEEMRNLLQKYTDQIIPFEWCNDFAKARNVGLSQAKGEWFLFLDDDEWFEDVEPILSFFESGEYKEYQQAVYKARNYENFEGTAYTQEWVSRMIRLEKDTRFVGRVHECLEPVSGKCKALDAFVHHYGYVFRNDEERMAHIHRNVSILEKLMSEEPKNIKWPYQLLLEYKSMGDYTALRRVAQASLRKLQNVNEPFLNQCRGSFYIAILFCDWQEEAYEQMLWDVEEFLEDRRNSSQVVCALCWQGAKAAQKQKDDASLLKLTLRYEKQYQKYQSAQRSEQQQIIDESILLVHEAMAEEVAAAMRDLCMTVRIHLDQMEEIPQDWVDGLAQDIRGQMEGNGEFLMLSADVWKLGASGRLPLEEMLLAQPLSQWMLAALILEKKKDIELWKTLRSYLESVKTKKDIRYDYFGAQMAKASVQTDVSDWTYLELGQLLELFAVRCLEFAKQVYTPEAFEGEMEVLPDYIRCAVSMNKQCHRGELSYKERLQDLKTCIKLWPPIAPAVKCYIKHIGKEEERVHNQAQEAQQQLRQMATQVLRQVEVLREAGENAQALSVVRQLRQMLPEDEQIKQIERELELKCS